MQAFIKHITVYFAACGSVTVQLRPESSTPYIGTGYVMIKIQMCIHTGTNTAVVRLYFYLILQ